MEDLERRKERRLTRQFPALVHCRPGSGISIEGVSEDLSQSGAFIKTKSWHSFQVNDRVVVTFFLPSDFTGQDKTIGLQGEAFITRVDRENEGIGVQFVKTFKQFDQIAVPDVSGKIKYENLAYCLSNFVNVPLPEFTSTYPNGFLVERSQNFFDRSVILQITTEVTEDPYVLEHIKQDFVQIKVLKARVIEIKKRISFTDSRKIKIGRAPNNDIILYNKKVSKDHAYFKLTPSGNECYLIDSGSTNGTFLNNSKIKLHEERQLVDGDEISFGPETRAIYFSSRAFHRFLSELKSRHKE